MKKYRIRWESETKNDESGEFFVEARSFEEAFENAMELGRIPWTKINAEVKSAGEHVGFVTAWQRSPQTRWNIYNDLAGESWEPGLKMVYRLTPPPPTEE